MRYLSVCSGIEAATVAWHPLGWTAAAFSEIDAFPRAVLAHHYPDVPCHGDFTTIGADEYGPIDLLVGGTPCQSFSVAGLRGGLADDRGNLALQFLKLAQRTRPRWLVWENVPGVLSSNGGRDFGCILGGMVELGYGIAYRVLDAQFFGVAQRRRRVFVVGYLGDWRRAAAVLFERHSLQGHPPPRREKGPAVAALTADGVGTCGADDNQGQAGHLIPAGIGPDNQTARSLTASHTATGRLDPNECTLVSVPILEAGARTGNSTDDPRAGMGVGEPGDPMFTLQSGKQHAIAFSAKDHGADAMDDCSPTLRAGGYSKSHANAGVMPAVALRVDVPHIEDPFAVQPCLSRTAGGPGSQDWRFHAATVQGSAVRRLTPVECERLQGFPDDYTAVPYRGKPAADGPRYKALGNSMAVPVMAWIGERIAMVEALSEQRKAA